MFDYAIVYSGDYEFLFPAQSQHQTKSTGNVLPVHLHDFNPDGLPALFCLQETNLQKGLSLFARFEPAQRKLSIVTGRMAARETVPLNQPPSVILLPWCDDVLFQHWLLLLAGKPNVPVFLNWFYPALNFQEHYTEYVRWVRVFANCASQLKQRRLTASELANKLHYSSTGLTDKLIKRTKALFGETPGRLLRVWHTFSVTAECMRRERELENNPNGRSPLPDTPNDYRRTLQRLLGISYSELKKASEEEHWAAVWMRAWRERNM